MNNHSTRFKNNVVIITGAAGGIGSAIAKAFLEAGARVALVDASEKLYSLFKENQAESECKLLLFQVDLQERGSNDKIINESIAKWGRIDILVNAIGVNVRKKLDDYTDQDLDWIYNINVKSIFQLSNSVAAVMKPQNYGKIINISSIQATTCWNGKGTFSLAPYCASKSAVIAMTKAFALDLAPYQINVNAICPAFVDTELVKPVRDDKILYDDIINRTPLGRFADPQEIVGPVLFLASNESSFVTGHALMVDGGWTIE